MRAASAQQLAIQLQHVMGYVEYIEQPLPGLRRKISPDGMRMCWIDSYQKKGQRIIEIGLLIEGNPDIDLLDHAPIQLDLLQQGLALLLQPGNLRPQGRQLALQCLDRRVSPIHTLIISSAGRQLARLWGVTDTGQR